MIGLADTKAARPPSHWVDGYAKGTATTLTVKPNVTGLSYLYDDFNDVDDWVMVHGRLLVSGGATSDVYGPLTGYAAGYHKTQLLSDNCRAKVTIQDGVIIYGESRVFICSDKRMNRYYGMSIKYDVLTSQVRILRGKSSIAADAYETTTVSISAGDEFEIWYDRINSTVRIYQNGSEIASKYFPPNDIPHGPECRYVGVVMSPGWLLSQGPRFDDFEAWDVTLPAPEINDPIDSLTPNPNWVEVSGQVDVHRHLFFPLSLGPKVAIFTRAAIRWTTPLNTNSAKVVVTVYRIGALGEYTVVVRSNAAMTNWVGIQFDLLGSTIKVVQGSGPETFTQRGSSALWQFVSVGQQYTITWDEATETIACYRGASRTPIVSWSAGANFNGTGRYVGMTWYTGLAVTGVEPTAFTAYDVTADQPLP